jgi:hypothetical protein
MAVMLPTLYNDLIHAYRARHVLESLLAEVSGSRLVADLVVDARRDADPAGRGERVNARCDVDAVAQYCVVGEHHVAEGRRYRSRGVEPAVSGATTMCRTLTFWP